VAVTFFPLRCHYQSFTIALKLLHGTVALPLEKFTVAQ
jgi:hypothetical protein